MASLDLPIPEAAAHVWGWFHELSGTRQNGMSINPINHQEIKAWSELTGIKPAAWELSAIRGIDAAQISSILEDQEKPKAKT